MSVQCPKCQGTRVESNGVREAAHKVVHGAHLGSHVLHVSPVLAVGTMAVAALTSWLSGPAHTCQVCKHSF
jgi:hypothetical protein